jgi:hypothetical protein
MFKGLLLKGISGRVKGQEALKIWGRFNGVKEG